MAQMESEAWKKSHDMPHEILMDRKGLKFADLSASIQRDITLFNETFNRALSDGYVDDQEEDDLTLKSHRIADRIKQDHGDDDSGGVSAAGIITGVAIAIGAFFGIRQITKL